MHVLFYATVANEISFKWKPIQPLYHITYLQH